VTIEDQVAAIFARANPVPSLAQFDPIELVDIDRLTDQSERSSEMSELHRIEPELDQQPKQRPILGLVATGIIVVATAVVVIALANRPPEVVAGPVELSESTLVEQTTSPAATSQPLEIAESFMNALNAHDVDAMLAFTDEEVLATQEMNFSIEWFRSEIEQEGVLGWTYHFTCEIAEEYRNGTLVRCPYSFTNHITEVFGLDPYEGSEVTLLIADGEVTSYTNNEFSDEWEAEDGALGMFFNWMIENHPEDRRRHYNYTDEANLNFWKKYIPLLLASEEAAG
jgi:hypothetical protein